MQVYLDGMPLLEGVDWDYDDSDMQSITVVGDWCGKLTSGNVNEARIEFPCGDVIID